MSKGTQAKSTVNTKKSNSQTVGISKISIGSVKNGRVTSEAPTRPVKPATGKK
jgi:hypothetical protein